MYKFILVLGLFCHFHVVKAQNTISGSIQNNQNQPLEGATIFISETHQGTVSDSNGLFELNHLPNGKITVQFSFVGYANHIETVQLSGKPIQLQITLLESAIESEEIVISAGYNTTQHDNAVKIEVFKVHPMEVKITPNFAEMLTKVPGVDMISKGSGVSKPVIRGLSMNDILVLNNGVRFENYQYSSHHPLGIDEFGIENVEIIKGPASLLYGSDAIGGVINFIKEKPAPINSFQGDYNAQFFSNSLGYNNNIGLKGASEKVFGSIRLGQKSNADYLQGGGAFVPNSRFNEKSFKSNIGLTNTLGTFKLFYDFNQERLGLVEDEAIENIEKRGRKVEMMYQGFNTHLISSQNKLHLGTLKLDVNAAFQNTELAHVDEEGEYELQMQLETLTYETKFYLPSSEKLDYILGFQGFNQKNININERETILLPDAVTQNYSVFGMMQIQPLENLKIQTGLRFDTKSIETEAVTDELTSEITRNALEVSYQSLSGSLGVTFHVNDFALIRGNLASAYRTPNLAELTSDGPHELRYEIGNSELDPEKSWETDLSFHYHKNDFTIDIAAYLNTIKNYIFIAPTGSNTEEGLPIFKYRQSDSKLYGGEIGIHYHPKNLKFLHFESTFANVVGKQNNGTFLPFVPAHKLNFEVRAEKEKLAFFKNTFIAFSVQNAFKQENTADDETPTDAYSLFDTSLGGSIPWDNQNINLQLSVTNMFDQKYIDHLSTLKEVGLFNPGRSFNISLRIPF